MSKYICTIIIGSIGSFVGMKLKIPAGTMIGAMVSVAIFNITCGKGAMPNSFMIAAQVVVGSMIGLRFSKDTIIGLKNIALPALILVAGLTMFCIIIGLIIARFSGFDLITALFSSAPGGITDMTIMSESFGADISKVALMHLVRMITVITVMPFLLKLITKLAHLK